MNYGEKGHFDDPRDNLNSENWAINPEMTNNQVIFSSEKNIETSPEDTLGQIIDLTPAPAPAIVQTDNAPQDQTPEKNRNLQPIMGDHFNSDVATEIHRAENELSQTGNISDFYNEIRDMAEIATENWVA